MCIRDRSREAAAGQLGQNSGNAFEYVITYKGKFNQEKDYGDIILKSLGDGQFPVSYTHLDVYKRQVHDFK